MNIIKLLKNRNQIIEGIKNSIFKKEHVEDIAREREVICQSNKCNSYDVTGSGCELFGSQPCCDKRNGGCGCSLVFKLRSLSSGCPKGYWDPILTEEEEDKLTQSISV